MEDEETPETICEASIHKFPEPEIRKGEFWDMLSEMNPDALIFDGPGAVDMFDNCIIGIGDRIGQPPVLVYEEERMVQSLWDDGWSYEEAIEWLYINTFGSYLGENTPIILKMVESAPFFKTGGGTLHLEN